MIDAHNLQYDDNIIEWKKNDNIVKSHNVEDYLVVLNPQDESPENETRNEQYRERAVFYGISGQTVQGMTGSIFRKPPVSALPKELEYLNKNADGGGVSLNQLAKGCAADVLTCGRAGLAVSFPYSETQVSKADMTSGKVVATVHRFEAAQVINWSTVTVGSNTKLSLVVILESEEIVEDYKAKQVDVIREMFLSDGIYKERKWTKTDGEWVPGEEWTPTDSKGAAWDEIPFTFIGAENNDSKVDKAPLSNIVDLNIGHFRNSADYEDSVWFVGQAQPWMSGVTQEHIDLLSNNNMYAGSRNLMAVPEGESFGYAQASPNPLVRQAMLDKLDGMVSMGARLMQAGSATKTATQAAGDIESQTSTLGMVAENVSDAFQTALKWCAKYMGASDEIEYQLNEDFINLSQDPALIKEVVADFMLGGVPMRDYIRFMRKVELFDEETTDEEYADLITIPGAEM